VREKLIGDHRERQVDDLHFVLPHQVQQQVERASIRFEIDAKVHRGFVDRRGTLQGRRLRAT
jgi:hypothetical protein